eukprot:jgi/Tetstr1/437197/TSEL_002767.t1
MMALRTVTSVVPCTATGPLKRAIGTTDIHGAGTKHPVGDVNPFILLDGVPPIAKKDTPGFGMHPHAGLQVATLGFAGSVRSKLGHAEGEDLVVGAGGGAWMLATYAGRGASHDEHTASDTETRMSQLAWLIPEANRDDPARCDHADDMAPKLLDGGKVEAWDVAQQGLFEGHPEPSAKLPAPIRIDVVMSRIQPGGTLSVKEMTPGGAFAFIANPDFPGKVDVSGTELAASELAILSAECGPVTVRNDGGDPVEVLLGAGQRVEEPWVKILHSNGFLIAKDAEAARAKAAQFDLEGPERFGQA